MDDFLVIDRVSKSFGTQRVVEEVSLTIARGEAFSLLGPSGCGKTTLLRMIAGFEQPEHGRILLGGRDITHLPPERRPVNTVFQNYAIFPHLTVWDNVAFGLRMERRSREETRLEVERMLELVRLSAHAKKMPALLSGGQRQRVALARALVKRPEVLLLDEPLAALDLKLRQHMLAELSSLHAQVGATFIYVTHDQGEALSLSDRVAVLNEGRVEQIGTPEQVYESPSSSFTAAFIGDTNFLTGTTVLAPHEGCVHVRVDGIDGSPWIVPHRLPQVLGQTVRLMVRPEKIHLSPQSAAVNEGTNSFSGIIDDVAYFGPHTRYRIRAGVHAIIAQIQHGQPGSALARGDQVWVSFHPDSARVMGMEVGG